MKTTISQRFMVAIKATGMSYVDFGNKIGISKQMVSSWKNEKRPVPDKYILRSIEMFDLDANFVIKGTETTPEIQEKMFQEQIRIFNEALKSKDELIKMKDELLKMKDELHKLSNNK